MFRDRVGSATWMAEIGAAEGVRGAMIRKAGWTGFGGSVTEVGPRGSTCGAESPAATATWRWRSTALGVGVESAISLSLSNNK